MRDFTKELPDHTEKYIGENDLFLEIFEGDNLPKATKLFGTQVGTREAVTHRLQLPKTGMVINKCDYPY